MKQKELADCVYDLIWGNLDIENYPVPESSIVKDEFYSGSFCANAYDSALAAYSRLCLRLGTEELNDRDVDQLFTSLLAISRYVGLKVFEYGQILEKKK